MKIERIYREKRKVRRTPAKKNYIYYSCYAICIIIKVVMVFKILFFIFASSLYPSMQDIFSPLWWCFFIDDENLIFKVLGIEKIYLFFIVVPKIYFGI